MEGGGTKPEAGGLRIKRSCADDLSSRADEGLYSEAMVKVVHQA